ncbi:DUF427 domain-containing protein [Trichothermofontia sichuanensis B231]|uniref:DUF427 domain-containing protein n=1 Tax=Trichothermofontia sichuanensis TaxID=3045816 RepID=UPI0022451FA9|nr:DUF427 domain-containing protein [Trichothermofontia sichuanensis]UZQ53979.1 DUF427 domain-containing protein [Trichothermofontia sichuanensis B231]
MSPTPIPPGPGQESVWDYPRPARWEETSQVIRVVFNGVTIAQTRQGKRVLETSHPPTYYIPATDIQLDCLRETSRVSVCEWKGRCRYYDVVVQGKRANFAAWRYFDPTPAFRAIQDAYGFYASRMDACYLDDELVTPQPGNFYGGWITHKIVGPFKGGPGTLGW